MKLVSVLAGSVLGLALSLNAGAAEMYLGRSFHLLKFDAPSILTNHGTKMTVEYIVNPTTGKWELVWGDKFWKETWVKEYLQFEGNSDDVHNGGTVKVLKPVTVALVMFGGGETTVDLTHLPSCHAEIKNPPKTGSTPSKRFAPPPAK